MTNEEPRHNSQVVTGEIVQAGQDTHLARQDVMPDFAISLEEANRRIKMLQEFVRDHMVNGEDYGVIPGTSAKPTLFKPGAEKLNAIFGLAPCLEVTERVEDWDNGFLHYEVKVTLLNKRTSTVEAEGIGSCNSRERKYKNQDAASIANTILKMAKKRALVDATLSATRASGLFTQDLEDQEEGDKPAKQPQRPPQQQHRQQPAQPRPSGGSGSGGGSGSNAATEAQRGAILSMANKMWGARAHEELTRLSPDKPVAQLSKSEASALIDKLRQSLMQQQNPQGSQ